MDAGLAAVLGALVGGVVPGGIALMREWNEQRRTRRALIRVVHGQLTTLEALLGGCLRAGHWWPESMNPTVDLSYDDRKLLAATVSAETWNVLDGALQMIESLRGQRESQRWPPDNPVPDLNDVTRDSISNVLRFITEAACALENDAGSAIVPFRRDILQSEAAESS
jgi:hypothetical protein